MTRRIALLYRLLSVQARALLVMTALLLVLERLFLALGAIGIARRPFFALGASGLIVMLWGIRALLRQRTSIEARHKLTMVIAESALGGRADGTFLPGREAEAAVFEGRSAAEQVLVRHLPPFFAEPVAALILFSIIRPTGVPVLASAAAIGGAALILAFLRNPTAQKQRGAWAKYMHVAQSTLTSVRAATELVASGHELAYLERLRGATYDWTRTAARAERSAAAFQRIPFAALALVGLALLARARSLEFDKAIRLGVFFPPLAGLMRTIFDLVRSGPKLATLDPCFAVACTAAGGSARQSAPSGPAEIRFDRVSFSFDGTLVLRDVSFVWKPGGVVGIRGPNGSGKSTLLRLALGLLRPDSGNITVGGVDLDQIDLPTWRKTIAYLPQRPYVPDRSTVYETMRLTVPTLTENEARNALTLTGAWDQVRRSSDGKVEPLGVEMSSLSVGARQRVLLARAFAQPRTVILLDEPDENLDGSTRALLGRLVRNLRSTHMVAIATHDETLLAVADLSLHLNPDLDR